MVETQLVTQICFQMVGKYLVTCSCLNFRDTSSYTLVFKCRATPSFTLVSKWSGHQVKHSFPIGRETSGYALAFKWSGHIRLHTCFRKSGTPGYTRVFKWLGHLRLHVHFQIVGTHALFPLVELHPVTHSFSNSWEPLCYMLVFRWSGHIRLNTRFQSVRTYPVTHSFSNGRDTSG